MAVIDRVQLVEDAKCYLPDSNVLDDATLTKLADNVVDYKIPADDDIYYSQALCLLLQSAAFLNKSKYSVDAGGKKREKAGGVEVENFEGTGNKVWDDYLKGLSDLCPLLPGGGYNLPRAAGIFINPSDKFVINDCPCPDDLIL